MSRDCVICGAPFLRKERSHAVTCSDRCRLLTHIVPVENGCWHWLGTQDGRGYGDISFNGRRHVKAHRAVYEVFVGPIPPGLSLDHLCHNRDSACTDGSTCTHRKCVNPEHLEPIEQSENIRRGVRIGYFANPNVCRKGHDWNVHPPELAQRTDGTVTRRCWVCRTERRIGRPHSCEKCGTEAVA